MSAWDAIVVGSGFGGAMAAQPLVAAGARVLMLERGGWPERGDSAWQPEAALNLGPHMLRDVRARADGRSRMAGRCACVGGPSVYFGAAAIRFRQADFEGDPQIVGNSEAAWPFGYDAIEPYYGEAERLLGVSGDDRGDPTAPPRSNAFPAAPAPLEPFSRRVAEAAAGLGHSPFRLPLAIDDGACRHCQMCDGFACAIGAKNDVATRMIMPLIGRGMTLWTEAKAIALETERGRAKRLRVARSGEQAPIVVEGDRFILAAGALGSAGLVLASRLEALNSAGAAVGRYLTRHANARVVGLYSRPINPEQRFLKQLALTDHYFGDPDNPTVAGFRRLGSLQQMMLSPPDLVRHIAPFGVKRLAAMAAERATAILCIAEDQPRAENRVSVDWSRRDSDGSPALIAECSYSRRDQLARSALVKRAKELLRATGARLVHTHHVTTLSHAAGTLRMGLDPSSSPVDPNGRFRGLDNLWVSDASTMPTSAGVNPALTIAANALRIGEAAAAA